MRTYKKGKLLTCKECEQLTQGTLVWVENEFNNNGVFKVIDNRISSKDYSWSFIIGCNGMADSIPSIRVFEYIEEVELPAKPQTQFTGWEILKNIDEGFLKEGTKFINEYGVTYIVKKEYENGKDRLYLGLCNDEHYVTSQALQFRTFTIKAKEYLTFDEARNSGEPFKHKNMMDFNDDIWEVFEQLRIFGSNKINKMLSEKLWEIGYNK